MDYLKIYNQLIERAQSRDDETTFYEKHHVIPRCIGGTDNPSNIVKLTPEEHYVAHQLLVKIYPHNAKLSFAASMMIPNRPNNKLYGWLRRRISQNMKRDNPNRNGRARNAYIQTYGKPPKVSRDYVTDKWRQSISERSKGSANPNYGIKPWNHGRATPESLKVWFNADICYDWWVKHQKSYSAMSKAFGFERYVCFMNVVKYFKNGWVPKDDPEWVDFHNKNKGNYVYF